MSIFWLFKKFYNFKNIKIITIYIINIFYNLKTGLIKWRFYFIIKILAWLKFVKILF